MPPLPSKKKSNLHSGLFKDHIPLGGCPEGAKCHPTILTISLNGWNGQHPRREREMDHSRKISIKV